MIPYFFPELTSGSRILTLICFILSFLLTILCLTFLQNKLPRDGGREFAVNGEKSKGKPRGAGIIFILVFTFLACLLLEIGAETCIYLIMIVGAMLSGYLDDASTHPWGRIKKGLLDFVIAAVCAVTYINFNGSTIHFLCFDGSITLHPVLFGALAIFLIFSAINVVNCTDGVDGLCATLAIISLISFYLVYQKLGDTLYGSLILTFLLSLMGYLWFNASPSRLMMGDAGSRAVGLLLAVLSLKTNSPLLFLPFCLLFLFDGGLGLLKIVLIKLFHRPMMTKVRTPLHDHARKVAGWSDTQTVFRFTILQVVASALVLYFIL